MSIEKIVRCDMCGAEIDYRDPFGQFVGSHFHSESEALDLCERCSDEVQRFIAGKESHSEMSQKQLDAISTLKALDSSQDIGCSEVVNVMEAAFGVDGIHELLSKLIIVLEGGRL